MCNASMGLTIASGAMSAIGSLRAGASSRASAAAESSLLMQDAAEMERQAQDAAWRGEQERSDMRLQLLQLAAQGRAAYAASNVLVDTGTPLDWERDIARRAALDIEMARHNTLMEQYGFMRQAQATRMKARVVKSVAKSTSSAFEALGSLMNAAGSVMKNPAFPGYTDASLGVGRQA